jgi:hypothetical protein
MLIWYEKNPPPPGKRVGEKMMLFSFDACIIPTVMMFNTVRSAGRGTKKKKKTRRYVPPQNGFLFFFFFVVVAAGGRKKKRSNISSTLVCIYTTCFFCHGY